MGGLGWQQVLLALAWASWLSDIEILLVYEYEFILLFFTRLDVRHVGSVLLNTSNTSLISRSGKSPQVHFIKDVCQSTAYSLVHRS